MLRAVRFAARLGFRIDPATQAAIVAAAPTLPDMAAERIGDEIVKILTEGGARRGFELLDATGLLPVVLPEVARMHGVAQSPDSPSRGRRVEAHAPAARPARPPAFPRRSRWAPCCTTSPSRCARAARAIASRSTATPTSARTWPSRSASACGAAARPGSASTTSCATTSGSSRRRRCGSPRSRRCSARTASTSSAVSRASTPSRRAATCASCSSASGARPSWAPRPCARRACSAATDLLALGYRAGPRVGEILRAAGRRAARGRGADAGRRRGARPRALPRWNPETSQDVRRPQVLDEQADAVSGRAARRERQLAVGERRRRRCRGAPTARRRRTRRGRARR